MNPLAPDVAKQCEELLTPDQLRAVRECEERLVAYRLAKQRKLANSISDMDDVNFAFMADASDAHKRGLE